MIYLFLSIASATSLFVIFNYFERFKVDNFQAITVNYLVACGFGIWYASQRSAPLRIDGDAPWLWVAIVVGILFIANFQIMAVTTQSNGVSIAGVATKMSMVIPALFFIIFDPNEGFTVFKAIGISLGILAVILASSRDGITLKANRNALLPLLLFSASGLLDLLLAYAEKSYLVSSTFLIFIAFTFGISTLVGSLILGVNILRKHQKINFRSVVGGIILGFVNYGTIYFFLKLLGSGLMDRSSAIPANSIGTVAFSTLAGYIIFKERLSTRQKVGIAFALIALFLFIPFR